MSRPSLNIPKAQVALNEGEWPDRDWYGFWRELQIRAPVTGSVLFVAATTAAVTLISPEATTDYMVLVEAPEDRRVWITSKATTGFTINVSSASSATYSWALIRM